MRLPACCNSTAAVRPTIPPPTTATSTATSPPSGRCSGTLPATLATQNGFPGELDTDIPPSLFSTSLTGRSRRGGRPPGPPALPPVRGGPLPRPALLRRCRAGDVLTGSSRTSGLGVG